MIRTWNRSHLVFDRNSSGWPVRVSSAVLAGHLHVAAERHGADAVFGVAAREAEEPWAEAERKLQHPDADAPGRQEVAQLVDENEHADDKSESQDVVTTATLRPSILRSPASVARGRAPSDPRAAPSPASSRLLHIVCASMRLVDDARNAGKRQPSLEKRLDGHFVGRIQHDRIAVPPAAERR